MGYVCSHARRLLCEEYPAVPDPPVSRARCPRARPRVHAPAPIIEHTYGTEHTFPLHTPTSDVAGWINVYVGSRFGEVLKRFGWSWCPSDPAPSVRINIRPVRPCPVRPCVACTSPVRRCIDLPRYRDRTRTHVRPPSTYHDLNPTGCGSLYVGSRLAEVLTRFGWAGSVRAALARVCACYSVRAGGTRRLWILPSSRYATSRAFRACHDCRPKPILHHQRSRIDRQAPGVTNSTATLVISNPEWSCPWSNNLANWRCGSTLAGSSVAITPTYLAIDGHEP